VPPAPPAPPDVLALSAAEARRLAPGAQGFGAPRPKGPVTTAQVRRTIDRLRLLQLDSINVLVRAHYMPLFSRLGPYDRAILDRLAYERRELFEFWALEASLVPTRLHPWLRWRMALKPWGTIATMLRVEPHACDAILAEVTARGGIGAGELADPGGRGGAWWGWGRGKHVLEWLFATGRVTTTSRRGFERLYDLVERVLPADVLGAPTPPPDVARKALLVESARALGVATARDLADYFRLHKPTARALVDELVAEGTLRQVRVEGWRHAAFAPRDLRPPAGRAASCALLSPFDSLVFERARTERLFGFRYRVEIYVPAPKRTYGYYVLPFLLDGHLVARVDLKADRANGRLLVKAAHLEAGRDAGRTAEALAAELRAMADWLELERVVVERRGDLHRALRAAVAGPIAPRSASAVATGGRRGTRSTA